MNENATRMINNLVCILVLLFSCFVSFSLSSTNFQPHKINWFLTSKTGKSASVQCFTATPSGHLVVGGTFTEDLYLYPNVLEVVEHKNETKVNETEPSASFENTSPYSLTRHSLFVIKLNETDGTILWQYSVDCETSACKFYDVGVSSDTQNNAFVFMTVFLPLSTQIHPFTQPGGPLFFVLSLNDGTLQWNTQYLCYSIDCYLPFNVLIRGDEVYVSGRGKEDTYLSKGGFKEYRDSNNELVMNSFVQAFRRKTNSFEMEPIWTIQTHSTNSTAYIKIFQSTISNTTLYLSGYYSGVTTWIDRKQKNFTVVDNINTDFHSFYILKFDISGNIIDLWTNTSYRFEFRTGMYVKQVGSETFVATCMDNEGLTSFTCITLLDDKKLKFYSSYNSALNQYENFDRLCKKVHVFGIAGISKDLYIAMRCIYTDTYGKDQVEYKVNVRSITNYRKGEWQASYTMYGNSSTLSLQRHEDTNSVNVLINTNGHFKESVSNYTFYHEQSAFTLFELPFMYPLTTCFGIGSNDTSVCSSRGVCIFQNECECQSGWGSPNCQFPICGGLLSNDTNVCSGVGNCTNPDVCECLSGQYSGDICQYPICFGVQSNEDLVCSSHGGCVSPNRCECWEGYTGNECQYSICNGNPSNHSNVCSGHGNCTMPRVCECENNYLGEWCQYPLCYNVSSNSTKVCGGFGSCNSPNNCSCLSGYFGLNCELNACYGIFSNDPNVCNGMGICKYPGICECQSGRAGKECRFPICFGKSLADNSSQVCHGKGNCSRVDFCECENGWEGRECQFPICYGKTANSSAIIENNGTFACYGNGNCISPDFCECNKNYTGNECNIPICYNISALNESACSNSNGICVAPNTCQCNAGRSGLKCEYSKCFEYGSDSPLVCSGHGQCTGFDSCNCSQGYTGSACEIPYCYGALANETSACSGRGNCTEKDTCQCKIGFSGLNCEWINCFGTLSNYSNVCSGHGSCQAPDNCECSSGYIGSTCQYPVCYGIGANETMVCNRKGNCTKPDYCLCENGRFSGLECDQPVCFGNSANDSNVCNYGNGTCLEPNVCKCNSKYGGPDCTMPVCFGILSNNAQVCSANGSCSSPDICQCNTGYFGESCQFKYCFGISSEDSSVCNGHGNCTVKDTCRCRPNYEGTQCEFPKCRGISANNTNTCNSRGVCVAPDICQCDSGHFGRFCEYFSCFGIPSNDPAVCNYGNGTCYDRDSCRCNGKYSGKNCSEFTCNNLKPDDLNVCNSRGNCTDYNNCECTGGYYGNNCERKIDAAAVSETSWIVAVSVSLPIGFIFILSTICCCLLYYLNSRRWKRNNSQEHEVHKKLMEMSLTAEHLEGQDSPFHLLRPSLGEYRELDEFSDPASITSSHISSSGNAANSNLGESTVAAGIKSISESKIFIPYKDLEFEKKLGSGGGGEVYKAKWKQNQVAVKKVEELDSFLKEVTLLHNLKHPNIVTIYGVSVLQGYYLIVMEYMPKGSLESFLYQLRIGALHIKLSDKISILLDISKGMDYLHSLNPPIIHRDLKPGNILMENSNKCVIADFGLSRAITKNTNMTNNIGTLYYMANEQFEDNGKSITTDTVVALDVYSFSIICWELFFEENPYIYHEKNRKKLFRETDYETSEYKKAENNSFNVPGMVLRGVRPIIPFSSLQSCKEWCDEYLENEKSKYEIVYSFTQLVKSCWDCNPHKRPSFSEITQKLMAFEELFRK